MRLGAPFTGVRTYVAVRGGVAVDLIAGSRSTDMLAGLGPPALAPGDQLPVGPPSHPLPSMDIAPVADPQGGDVLV